MDREELFRPYDGPEKYIFVSYYHGDAEKVHEIITAFYNEGYRLWHDWGIQAGDDLMRQLAEKERGCSAFFCFLSPGYVDSPLCMRELDYALAKHLNVIPIMLETFELSDAVEFRICMLQRDNLSRYETTGEFVDHLARAAEQLLTPCRSAKKPAARKPAERKEEKKEYASDMTGEAALESLFGDTGVLPGSESFGAVKSEPAPGANPRPQSQTMTFINIFLASSVVELKDDRLAIGDYIRKLNDIYMERNVYFRLFLCEDEDAAMADIRKQEQYNQQIRQSQLFLILIFNNAGEYTREEFDVAYRSFREAGAPAIITCFRQGEGYSPQQSVLDFMKKLDGELGHYFRVYSHIDSLKLALLMQVKLMKLDLPVELEAGKVMISGQEALTLDSLPLLLNNSDYRQLRGEYESAEKAFQEAKARYLQNPEDDEAFFGASGRRNKARTALQEMEKFLFSMLTGMEEKGMKGELTLREREALALLEQGKSREASAMLDEKEIEADADRGASLAEQGRNIQEQCVRELLTKISIEMTMTSDPERFERIRRLYETAVGREERERLSRQATPKYIRYLIRQHDYQRGFVQAERYLKYMELEGKEAEVSRAGYLLGNLCLDTDRLDKAESFFSSAKNSFEKLREKDPERYLPDLASVCHGLGILYLRKGGYRRAEEELLRARELREKLAGEKPDTYSLPFTKTCNLLGTLYRETGRTGEAEENYLRAKEICERMEKEKPGKYLADAAAAGNNLGNLYSLAGRTEEAEKEYLRVKEIDLKLAAENPDAWLPDLATVRNNLGNLYKGKDRLAAAETEYLKAKEAYEKLAAKEPEAWLPPLAKVLANLGSLYTKSGALQRAEAELNQALEIQKKLSDKEPEVYLPEIGKVYGNLANLYKTAGNAEREKEALRMMDRVREDLDKLDTYRTLDQNNDSYINLYPESAPKKPLRQPHVRERKGILSIFRRKN